jgi:quinol monooxygenase YgiN
MLTLIAYLTAEENQVATLHEALVQMVAPSRAEPGCINYDLHQLADSPAGFVIYENWASPEALELHFNTPHFIALASQLDELLAEPMVLHRAEMISQQATQSSISKSVST